MTTATVADTDAPQTTPRGARPKPQSRFGRFYRRNPGVVLPGIALALLFLFVIVLPLFLQDPMEQNLADRLQGPSAAHLLGTDSFGRDELARLALGGRYSIGIGLLISLTAGVVSTALGLIAGFFPRTGNVIMRVSDAWMAFPGLVLAIIFSVALGPGIWTELLALGIGLIPFGARVMRSRTMEVATRSFVEAARVSGMSGFKILWVHVWPNVLPLTIVGTIVTIAGTMLADGGLSFLGLGIPLPTPTWGNMIADSRSYLYQAPHLLMFPGLMLAITVFFFNAFGTNLRPLFDPQTRALKDLERLRIKGNKTDRKRGRI